MPALLLVNHAIQIGNDVRIFEDPRRRFKRNAVFPAIDTILGLTLCQDHLYIQDCSTTPEGLRLPPSRSPVAALVCA